MGSHPVCAVISFKKRTQWFLENKKDLSKQIALLQLSDQDDKLFLLAIPNQQATGRCFRLSS